MLIQELRDLLWAHLGAISAGLEALLYLDAETTEALHHRRL